MFHAYLRNKFSIVRLLNRPDKNQDYKVTDFLRKNHIQNWDVPSKNRHILIFVKLMYRNHLNKFLTKKSTLP
jgi:hypothetical protein